MKFSVRKLLFALLGCIICMGCFSCSSFRNGSGTSDIDLNSGPSQIEEMLQRLSQLENTQQQLKTLLDHKDAQIDQLSQKVLILENEILTFQEEGTTSQKPVTPQKPLSAPENLYQQARNLLLEQHFDKALTLFQSFIEKYPQDELADNAMYWLGECYYSMGNFEKAIFTFQELVTGYPKGIKVPDALLKTGYAYLSLKDNNRAHHFLKLVITRYPFSEAADKAQNKLDTFN